MPFRLEILVKRAIKALIGSKKFVSLVRSYLIWFQDVVKTYFVPSVVPAAFWGEGSESGVQRQ